MNLQQETRQDRPRNSLPVPSFPLHRGRFSHRPQSRRGPSVQESARREARSPQRVRRMDRCRSGSDQEGGQGYSEGNLCPQDRLGEPMSSSFPSFHLLSSRALACSSRRSRTLSCALHLIFAFSHSATDTNLTFFLLQRNHPLLALPPLHLLLRILPPKQTSLHLPRSQNLPPQSRPRLVPEPLHGSSVHAHVRRGRFLLRRFSHAREEGSDRVVGFVGVEEG